MTVGQFFLGMVTLVVATIVYRWQRTVDRRLKMADEYRDYFVEYLAVSHDYYSLLHVKWGWGDHRELKSTSELGEIGDRMTFLRSAIELLGSAAVIEAVSRMNVALRMVEHRMEMLDSARADEGLSQKYLAAKDDLSEARKELIAVYRNELNDSFLGSLIKRNNREHL